MSTASSDTQLADLSEAAAVAERAPQTAAPSAGAPQSETPVVEEGVPVGRPVPPKGLAFVGLLTLVVGGWGGIVAFVGPTFGFSADGSTSWYWNELHALLWLVPGAVAAACGMLMLGLVPRAFIGRGRAASGLIGLLTAACGAWFVVGPVAWPVLRHSAGVFVPAGPLRELAYQVGYALGPGVLLAVLGALTIGWGVRSRRTVRAAAA